MAESIKEFSLADVATHSSSKDLYLVVHDKVYDCTSFVEEHPGGEEVMLDVGGQDATDAFEDVGHSDEARTILKGLEVGTLKRQAGDPPARTYKAATTAGGGPDKRASEGGIGSVALFAIVLVGATAAYYVYGMMQQQKVQGAA